jgi:hypothetical protein
MISDGSIGESLYSIYKANGVIKVQDNLKLTDQSIQNKNKDVYPRLFARHAFTLETDCKKNRDQLYQQANDLL